jgi:hypothetical protein
VPIATPEIYADMLDRAKKGAFAYPAINVSSSQLSLLQFVVSPKQSQMESFNFLGVALNTHLVRQLRTWLMAQLRSQSMPMLLQRITK